MTKLVGLIILFCTLLGAGSCSTLVIDQAVGAADGNDYTVVLSGFGQVASKGYLFAQVQEGTNGTGRVTLVFPKADCKRDACVKFQFVRPDGSYAANGAINKGFTSASVALSDLVGHDNPITRNDEGEYGMAALVYFTAPDGIEYSAVARGFVRLNVLRADYRPMACDDPAKAWAVPVTKDCQGQFTTAMRSVVCGRCQ